MLSKFREIASKKSWRILASELFNIDQAGNLKDVETNLLSIKKSGNLLFPMDRAREMKAYNG